MRVEVHDEVQNEEGLCFQKCTWHWDDDPPTSGYRFIWRDDDSGNLKPSRGQALIPDAATALELMALALRNKWFR